MTRATRRGARSRRMASSRKDRAHRSTPSSPVRVGLFPRSTVKILFFGRHFTYFRNFESVLRGLAERGHHIHLAADQDELTGGLQLVQTLAATYPNITYGDAPARVSDDDAWVANHLRLGLDYLRYQHRIFDRALTLRIRSRDRKSVV